MAQSVDYLTLDFDSGHDLRVLGSSPMSGSIVSMEFGIASLSPSAPTHAHILSPSLPLSLTLSSK